MSAIPIEKLHLFCCFFMTGVIWIIQWVHYPSFNYIEKSEFISFENFHGNRITFIVGPLMILELMTAFYLYFQKDSPFWIVNLVGVLLIWVSTFFLSVPAHTQLSEGYSIEIIRRLVVTNWPRTLLWSLRSLVLMFFI